MFSILISLSSLVSALAPLEQADSTGLYFGPWVDRLHGDSINGTNARLNYKPMSLFQGDVNLTSTLQSGLVDDIFAQVTGTGTDAIVYLTVYPYEGYANVSDAAIAQLGAKVANLTQSGTRIFIRYASEMNGAWFNYGQQPTAFIASWRKVVGSIRSAVSAVSSLDRLAFIWAPNSGLGYPFPSDKYSAQPGTAKWDRALDTNRDGKFDASDDPYTPFYPGDEWVDWVGMSTYTYGSKWLPQQGVNPAGWRTNDIPAPGKVEDLITGRNGMGSFNFYRMYCSSATTGKPMIITETAATVHLAVLQTNGQFTAPAGTDPDSRVAIKRGWWSQMLNSTFLSTYPKIKGLCTFEFIKFEEASWRDFTIMGGYGLSSPLGNDGDARNGLVLKALQTDLAGGMGNLIIWANQTVRVKVTTDPTSNSTTTDTATTAKKNGAFSCSRISLHSLALFFFIAALF